MKRIAIGLAATLALAACGGGGSVGQATAAPTTAPTTAPTAAPTTAPTTAPAPQTKLAFTADLKSNEQNPPVAGAEASCTGTATVTLDQTAKSGVFEMAVRGCPADAEITNAHIHKGAKGANGAVVVPSGLTAGEFKLTGGAGTMTKNIATIDAALLSDIITNPATYYFNIHSKANAPGVVRAQLVKKS